VTTRLIYDYAIFRDFIATKLAFIIVGTVDSKCFQLIGLIETSQGTFEGNAFFAVKATQVSD